jgi:hypothetical protein
VNPEEVQDIEDLFEFVRENTPGPADVARFGFAMNQVMMPYQGRYMVLKYAKGEMTLPPYARREGEPEVVPAAEFIFHINEFVNPGFRFGLDKHGQILCCVTRDPDAPLDSCGVPQGNTIH